jgi:hypothetical protein
MKVKVAHVLLLLFFYTHYYMSISQFDIFNIALLLSGAIFIVLYIAKDIFKL